MKRRTLLLSGIIILLFLIAFYSGKTAYTQSTEYVFQSSTQDISSVTTNNIELPLPVPSSISTENNQIRLDLEKIGVNRFFIIYSVIYGDQSHTAYHLYLTDLNRRDLDKEGLGEIFLKTETGEIIKPVAQLPIVNDFPEDQPLGWKIKIIVKFPYSTQRSEHSLVLTYQGEEFILTDIVY